MVQSKAQSKQRDRSRGAVRVTTGADDEMSSLFEDDFDSSEESTEFYVEKKGVNGKDANSKRTRNARVTSGHNAQRFEQDEDRDQPKRASERRKSAPRGYDHGGTNTGLQAYNEDEDLELEEADEVVGTLTCVRGPDEGMVLRLSEGRYTLGRGRDNSFVLKDIAVSRIQLRLEVNASGVMISDLGSGNGTRINGKRSNNGSLRGGDRIELGNTVLVFRAIANFSEPAESGKLVKPNLEPASQQRVLEAAERLVEELERDIADKAAAEPELYEDSDDWPAEPEEEAEPVKKMRRPQISSELDDPSPRTAADSPAARRHSRAEIKAEKRSGSESPRPRWNETRTQVPLSEVLPADEPLPNDDARDEDLEHLEDVGSASPSAPTAFAEEGAFDERKDARRVAPTDQTVAFLGGPLSSLESSANNDGDESVFSARIAPNAETRVAHANEVAHAQRGFHSSELPPEEDSRTLPARASTTSRWSNPTVLAALLLLFFCAGGAGVMYWVGDGGDPDPDPSLAGDEDLSPGEKEYRDWTQQASAAVEAGDYVKAMFAAGKAYTLRPNDPAAQALLNTVHLAKQQAEKNKVPVMPEGDVESPPVEQEGPNAKAEEARLAEQARQAERARLAEQARQAERARLAEQSRMAEQAKQRELARQRAEAERRRARAARAKAPSRPKRVPPQRTPKAKGMNDADAKSSFMNAVRALRNDDAKSGCGLMNQIIAKAPKSSPWRAKARNAVERYECD